MFNDIMEQLCDGNNYCWLSAGRKFVYGKIDYRSIRLHPNGIEFRTVYSSGLTGPNVFWSMPRKIAVAVVAQFST